MILQCIYAAYYYIYSSENFKMNEFAYEFLIAKMYLQLGR